VIFRVNGMIDKEKFQSLTRVRLQRLGDAKLYNGWLLEYAVQTVTIGFESLPAISFGDQLMAEAYLHGTRIVMPVRAVKITKEDSVFSCLAEPKISDSNESARIKCSAIPLTIYANGFDFEASTLDIAPGGIGILSPLPMVKGDIVEVQIRTAHGEIKTKAVICYNKDLDKELEGHYRVGLKFDELDRVNKARWQRNFDVVSWDQVLGVSTRKQAS